MKKYQVSPDSGTGFESSRIDFFVLIMDSPHDHKTSAFLFTTASNCSSGSLDKFITSSGFQRFSSSAGLRSACMSCPCSLIHPIPFQYPGKSNECPTKKVTYSTPHADSKKLQHYPKQSQAHMQLIYIIHPYLKPKASSRTQYDWPNPSVTHTRCAE